MLSHLKCMWSNQSSSLGYMALMTMVILFRECQLDLRLMKKSGEKSMSSEKWLTWSLTVIQQRHTMCKDREQYKNRCADVHTISLKRVEMIICEAKKWLWGWVISVSSWTECAKTEFTRNVLCDIFLKADQTGKLPLRLMMNLLYLEKVCCWGAFSELLKLKWKDKS